MMTHGTGMENTVSDGWTITPNDVTGGFDATFWVAEVGMVAVWQPSWDDMLRKLATYTAQGNKREMESL